jgi:hypothetical protein
LDDLATWIASAPTCPAGGGTGNATVWTGPRVTFTKANAVDPLQPANQDRLT